MDFPVFVDPQPDYLYISILLTEEAHCLLDVHDLFVSRGWISGAIVMANDGNPDRAMVLHGDFHPFEDRPNQGWISSFCQNSIRTGLGDGIDILHIESLLQVRDYG